MSDKDLKEISDYWTKKYPQVTTIFYPRIEGGKYFGKMMTLTQSFDLQADTIGELISQGESFLRAVN